MQPAIAQADADKELCPTPARAPSAQDGSPATTMSVMRPFFRDALLPFPGSRLELRGGDRLRGVDVAARLGCRWNAHFLMAVSGACGAQVAAGRSWFRMDPTLLTGPQGAGRTHVVRRLAQEAGVPHLAVTVAAEQGRVAMGGGAEGATAAAPSHLGMMVAGCGCANPVVEVRGVEAATSSTLGRLRGAMDPAFARLYDEALGIDFDLYEVTWMVPLQQGFAPPAEFEGVAVTIAITRPGDAASLDLARMEALVEVARDRGSNAVDPRLVGHLPTRAEWEAAETDGAHGRHLMALRAFERAFGMP